MPLGLTRYDGCEGLGGDQLHNYNLFLGSYRDE